MSLSDQLREFHVGKLQRYNALVAGGAGATSFDFVVITSADDDQSRGFQSAVDTMLAAHRIPACTRYEIIQDPPGAKIGSGGSTMFVIQEMRRRHGKARMDTAKVLIIHAGGHSKRLPNHSASGKLFAMVPVPMGPKGEDVCTMLEFQLLIYVDLPSIMGPGYFLCASDIITLFDSAQCDFTKPGFTALGHPSSLEIGTGHGVFIMDEKPKEGGLTTPCTQFIHKPSETWMREAGAVKRNEEGEDIVFTDSAYFFSVDVADILLTYYEARVAAHGPLGCELEAYGDFLQPCGPRADNKYFESFGNIGATGGEAELVAVRGGLYDALRNVPLHVLPLVTSKFYHIGTMGEVMYHLTRDTGFIHELGCTLHCCVSCQPPRGVNPSLLDPAACVMASVVAPDSVVGSDSIVEYSVLSTGASVGSRCLVSGIRLPKGGVVPDGIFLQCVPMSASRLPPGVVAQPGVVTYHVPHVLGTSDDIKKAATSVDGTRWTREWAGLTDLTLLTEEVGKVIGRPVSPWPHLEDSTDVKSRALWTAKIFPVARSEEDAAAMALQLLGARGALMKGEAVVWDGDLWGRCSGLVSILDTVLGKDLDAQTAERKALDAMRAQ